jgi:LuxR family maltose regulon positive regulatory protein
MSDPLCEAVLGVVGSAPRLPDLARSNLLLVPLDRRGQWYRYHHLFRDMLRAQLERLEPDLIPVLRARAAEWCARNGMPEEALEYSMVGGDVDRAADLVRQLWVPVFRQGRVATLWQWLRWLEERDGIRQYPILAVLAALLAAVLGQPAEAERWADAVDHGQYGNADGPAEAWAAVVRAFMCRHGVEQMRADADEAVRRCAALGLAAPAPALAQGVALVLAGDLSGGDASLQEAVSAGNETGGHEIHAEALGERSLVARARGEWGRAEALADQATAVLRQAGIESCFVSAVQAHTAMHRGDIPAARQELSRAQRLRPLLTYAIPYLAVQARIELIRVHLALTDIAGAKTLMREIDEVLRRRPGLGTLISEAEALRTQLSKERSRYVPGASALTTAELRLLPMLSTHLSFPDIARELFLSLNTIRSQTTSIYRKLGASSRNQAVSRSRELGLLDS